MIQKKRYTCFLIALGLILSTACRGQSQDDGGRSSAAFSNFYRVEKQSLNVENVMDCALTDDGCYYLQYFTTQEYLEAEDWLMDELLKQVPSSCIPRNKEGEAVFPEYRLLYYTTSGECLFDIDASAIIGPSLSTRPMCADEDGNVWIANTEVDGETETVSYTCTVISKEGAVNKTINLSPSEYISNVYDIQPLSNGKVGLTIESQNGVKYLEYDANGKEITKISLQMYQPEILLDDDQIVLFDNGVQTVCKIKDNQLTDEDDLPYEATDVVMLNHQMYWVGATGLFEYGTEKALISWDKMNMVYSPDEIRFTHDGNIRMISFFRFSDSNTQFTLYPSDVNPYSDMKTVTIAGYDIRSDTSLQHSLEVLNEGNLNCRYVIRDYEDEVDSFEQVREIMRLDIASGNAPDIYYDKYEDLDLRDFCKDDYLLDMSDYFAGHEDEFYYDIMKLHQEKPYVICTDFSVTCFSILSSTIADYETWNYTAFNDAFSQFDDAAMAQGIYTKEQLLEDALSVDINQYVNFQTGEVDFTKESFAQLLDWVNQVGCQEAWMCVGTEKLRNRTIMMEYEQFNGIDELLWLKSELPYLAWVGFPSTPDSLPYFARNMCAISASTKNKDEAYLFIDTMLSELCQNQVIDNPVRKSSFLLKMEKQYADYAEWLEPEMNINQWNKQALFQEYTDIIDDAKVCSSFSSKEIYAIVLEEAMAYFNGDRSIETVIQLIQERVSMYVGEVV